MKWNNSYSVLLFIFIFIISFYVNDYIFSEDPETPWEDSTWTIQKLPVIIIILIVVFIMTILLGDAFRIKGQGIFTELPLVSGGHSSINPHDVRMAVPTGENTEEEKYVVFATGGFSAMGFEFKGKEAFCVCPPEHFKTDMTAGKICKTKFYQVDFDDLPDYVQAELVLLPRFKEEAVTKKENLWYGETSKEDGTDTAGNHQVMRKLIAKNQEVNYLKNLIKEMREQWREYTRSKFVRYEDVIPPPKQD